MEVQRKNRLDAWGENFTDEERWAVYDKCRVLRWPGEVLDALEERGAERLPTRASWYRFLARMRRADAGRKIEKIAASVAEAQGVADRAGIRDEVFVETLKTLAVDRAMDGDDKAAQAFAHAAAAVWDRAQKRTELDLKAAAQQTKEAQLRLAREKFEAAQKRLDAVQGAVGEPKLTDAERIAKIKGIFGMK